MSDLNLLSDYVDLGPFAAEVNRDTRTIRRWMSEPDGLPYTRIGNRIQSTSRPRVIGSSRACVVRIRGAPATGPPAPRKPCEWSHRKRGG
jgi:hypothetical protein